MTESIGVKLVQVVSPVMPVSLSEAETDNKPYCVYELTVTPYQTKDGIYKYAGDVTIRLVGNTLDEINTKADQIVTAIAQGMNSSQYSASLQTRTKNCQENIWTIELVFIINQYN